MEDQPDLTTNLKSPKSNTSEEAHFQEQRKNAAMRAHLQEMAQKVNSDDMMFIDQLKSLSQNEKQ